MVRDASSSKNILTTGASRMLQSMWYMEKFSLYDAFAPGKYKDYVVNIILQTYLSAFVKYRVADIQYAWEEEREK